MSALPENIWTRPYTQEDPQNLHTFGLDLLNTVTLTSLNFWMRDARPPGLRTTLNVGVGYGDLNVGYKWLVHGSRSGERSPRSKQWLHGQPWLKLDEINLNTEKLVQIQWPKILTSGLRMILYCSRTCSRSTVVGATNLDIISTCSPIVRAPDQDPWVAIVTWDLSSASDPILKNLQSGVNWHQVFDITQPYFQSLASSVLYDGY